MLNRLAELYRTWDGCIEGPSQRQDGYIGQTFERFLVQNLILGPLFMPLYAVLWLAYGYERHPLERDARSAEDGARI